MLKLVLLLRYLGRRKIVLLSITAVGLSTALLIVVTSLFTGFIRAFEKTAVDAIGDVVVSPPIKFQQYQTFIERLEQTAAVEAATEGMTDDGVLTAYSLTDLCTWAQAKCAQYESWASSRKVGPR